MTRLRQTIARRLKSAQDTAALLTTFNDCDMSAVIAAREEYSRQLREEARRALGFMGFFAKAGVPRAQGRAGGQRPDRREEIVYHDYVDISVAVSAPNGLVVPVVRDATS
jgi:2-oxoglutarate dehydrogenase E2 component (dihydrolipoamide succinyltransferase)